MQDNLLTLTKNLERLCEQALQETDPAKQDKLTLEIHRVIEVRRRMQGKELSRDSVPRLAVARQKSA